MIKKASRISGYTLAAAVVIVAGITGGTVWRLSRGPVSLQFVMPVMHAALNSAGLGVDISFTDTVLVWDRDDHTLEIRATEIEVHEEDGGPRVAGVPQASVTLSLSALLDRRIAPTKIELIEPAIEALRREDGVIVLVEGADGSDAATRLLKELLEAFRRPMSQDDSGMRYFQTLSVQDARLTLRDVASDTVWHMPDGDFSLTREEGGIDADISGAVQSGDFSAVLAVEGRYTVADDVLRATIDIENFIPKDIPPSLMPHEALQGLDMRAAATLEIEYGFSSGLSGVFELAALNGVLDAPDFFVGAIDIDSVNLKGRYVGSEREAIIEDLSLTSGGVAVRADGIVVFEEDGPSLTLFADGKNMSVDELKRFWPPTFKPRTRAWFDQHVLEGRFDTFSAQVDLDQIGVQGVKRPADGLRLNFRFSGLKATYLNSMPPVEDASGYAVMNLADLTITVEQGRTLSLAVSDVKVHIDDLDIRNEQDADIEVVINGDISEALRLIDYPPLGYPTKFGMTPDSVLGTGAIRARFQFPLVANLKLEQVQFVAAATLRDVELPTLFASTTTDAGQFLLRVDPTMLEAEGTLSFNGVPFDVTWSERFGAGEGAPSHYLLNGVLDDEGWAKLGLPFNPRITGDAPVTVELAGKGKDITQGIGHLDMTAAEMAVEEFGWQKEGGAQAGLDFTFHTTPQGLDITSYELLAPELNATGQMTLHPDFSLIHAEVDMVIGMSDTMLDVYGQPDGGLEVFADGGTLDLQPIFAYVIAEKDDSTPLPSLNFNGYFKQALARNDVVLDGMVVRASFVQGWWEDGYFLAEMGEGDLSFSLMRDGANRVFEVAGSDAGRILDGLDYYTGGEGGTLNISGAIDDSRAGSPVEGDVLIEDILLQEAPVMAKMLTLASFTGIADTLDGGGIRFERVEVPFSMLNGVLNIRGAGAFGPALGITFEGQLNRREQMVNMGGSIIPSYTLNSFLGKIPIIGPIFSGKEGEGLLGFTYSVTGSADDPDVFVNPLSVFAPGFLRGIFRGSDRTDDIDEEQEGMAAPVE